MPKPLTILQGEPAVTAWLHGDFLGVLILPHSNGKSVSFYKYAGKVYAVLNGPVNEFAVQLFEALEDGELFTNILACELPHRETFEPGETITREYFVRLDLL